MAIGLLRATPAAHLQDELLVDAALGDVGLEVGRLEEAQEELVDELQMRPGRLQRRLVLLRVEFGAVRIARRRQRPKQVYGKLKRMRKKND